MKNQSLSIEEEVSKLLINQKLNIAVAESCTGGMVSARLINYPGISKVFIEGCVTYSNESKIKRLGVKKETLDEFGAVSEQTAIEMAQGIAKGFDTNVGLSTTGIAGPDGASEEKPVGLVYIGIYINGKTLVYKNIFKGDRSSIREQTVNEILNKLKLNLEG